MEKVLFLKGQFVEKIWGGSRLKKEFSYDFNSENIGEYWAISAMKDFSSIVINGAYKGEKLNDLYKNNKELFGNEKKEKFPLLIKLIDANDDLSIQVHPDEKMAKKENSYGKSECWYILNENKASIIYGLKTDDKKRALKLIDERRWDDLLKEENHIKGDFFRVDAGMVHAIKKGSLILEIQQASDITYRLYDYDRRDKEGNLRDLHIDKSKEAIKCLDSKKIHEDLEKEVEILLENEYFKVKKINVKDKINLKREDKYQLESVVKGKGELIIDDKTYPIKKGDFFILTNYVNNYTFKGNLEVVESSSK
ncbi:class I mannose-6-phosphate isomerase [Anaerococcus sp. AGMB00486]|uniref:Phosphohexomutase n=1 Tax=Anaerococcus faecalis TaxID=2742993 RepID=A0ABX2NBV3_9FIRM|nr:type I phosphomannose isomerase catalytic subunit [Anaerococcus faecalis]NVF12202.1 class I mannose-6-phosphate isomerase [Anaerococcus faecalis]